ncbi:unnamed protein product [Linum trigynum]|uniref:CCHC-type domain-containing protein n=1 Tax=Linum trigynum TaxID=586398 RepID=A0AAV2FB77_9ROSI
MSAASSTTSSTTNYVSSSSTPTISLPSNPQFTVKLTPNNYLLWKTQLLPLLRCFYLIGHIDGTLPPPPEAINSQPNPAYGEWYQRDQLVLIWINMSLSEVVLSTIVNKSTARDAWDSLARVYGSTLPVIVRQLRGSLKRLARGSESAHEYLQRAKGIADNLVALDDPVKESELVRALMDGLGDEYRPFTQNLEACLTPISFDDFSSHLLSEEMQLKRSQSVAGDLASPHAFYSGGGYRDRGGRTPRGRGGQNGYGGRGAYGHQNPWRPNPQPWPNSYSNQQFNQPMNAGVLGAEPSGPSKTICHNCGGRDHIRPNCPSPLYPDQSSYP